MQAVQCGHDLSTPSAHLVTDLLDPQAAMACTYVLDTSVLLADPRSVFRFDEHEVVMPLVVIAELEAKRHHPELGWAARRSSAAARGPPREVRLTGPLDADHSTSAGRSGSRSTTWTQPGCRRR